MTTDVPHLLVLEDITDPGDASGRLDGSGWRLPTRTVRDRKGNHFVLLSVGTYVRLLSERRPGTTDDNRRQEEPHGPH